MFTGIVEETGRIKEIKRGRASAVLTIEARKVLEDVKLGDSIAVNGVCLTVTDFTSYAFMADVMHETLNRSSLGALKNGSAVNLERAMKADGRFGPHRRDRHHSICRERRQRRMVYGEGSRGDNEVHRGERLHSHRRHQPYGSRRSRRRVPGFHNTPYVG